MSICDIIFPPRCILCDRVIPPTGKHICEKCLGLARPVGDCTCMKCGKPVESPDIEYCRDCERRPKSYRRGFPLYRYMSPVKESIARLKYSGRQEYALFYGEEIVRVYGRSFSDLNIGLVAPVPVHRSKLRLRGYNQAELLAEPIARGLGVVLKRELLLRTVDTPPQKELSDIERILNLEKAFEVNPKVDLGLIKGNILLVDDIYTTGSTIEACTRALTRGYKAIDKAPPEIYYTSIAIGVSKL